MQVDSPPHDQNFKLDHILQYPQKSFKEVLRRPAVELLLGPDTDYIKNTRVVEPAGSWAGNIVGIVMATMKADATRTIKKVSELAVEAKQHYTSKWLHFVS